jgi:vacuolar-type H+-ATPase subunit I/STV1
MFPSDIKKLIKLFFIVDIGVIVFTLLQSNFTWLLNTQFAFFSSLLITIASYLSYNKYVNRNVEYAIKDYQDRDSIDKIEDPYDLYDEPNENIKDNINENIQDTEQALEDTSENREKFKQVVEEEKQKLKKNSFKNTYRAFGAYSSLYRIAGYLSLVMGFFYLNNHGMFHTLSYLFGLFVVPFSATVFKLVK